MTKKKKKTLLVNKCLQSSLRDFKAIQYLKRDNSVLVRPSSSYLVMLGRILGGQKCLLSLTMLKVPNLIEWPFAQMIFFTFQPPKNCVFEARQFLVPPEKTASSRVLKRFTRESRRFLEQKMLPKRTEQSTNKKRDRRMWNFLADTDLKKLDWMNRLRSSSCIFVLFLPAASACILGLMRFNLDGFYIEWNL